MNRIVIRLCLFLFLINASCFASRPLSQAIEQEGGLDAKIDQARQSFDTIYYQLVERDFFPLTYNNNLIIGSDIHKNPQQDGAIILKLIEWLEKRGDRESLFLLKKLNKLFYLEFHRFIFSMSDNREDHAALLEACQELYQHKATMNGYLEKPFRTSLSKLYLLIAIINAGELSYDNKKQTLAYVLDKIKKEMNSINQRIENDKVDAGVIKKFITLLEVAAVREPLVQSTRLRNILIITSIVVVVCIILYYKVILPRWDEIPSWEKIRVLLGRAGDVVGQKFIEPIGRGAAKGALEELGKEENRERINAIFNPTIDRLQQTIPDVVEEAAGRAVQAASEGFRPTLDRLEQVVRDVPELTEEAARRGIDRLQQTIPDVVEEAAGRAAQAASEGFGPTLDRLEQVVRDVPELTEQAARRGAAGAMRQVPLLGRWYSAVPAALVAQPPGTGGAGQ